MKTLWKIGFGLSLSVGLAAAAIAQSPSDVAEATLETHFGADAFAPFAQSPFGTRISEIDAAVRRFATEHSLRSYAIERCPWMAGFRIDSRRFADPQWAEIKLHNQRSQGKYRVKVWNWADRSFDVLGIVVLTPNEDAHVRFAKPLPAAGPGGWVAGNAAGTLILGFESDDDAAPAPDFTVQWLRLTPLRRP